MKNLIFLLLSVLSSSCDDDSQKETQQGSEFADVTNVTISGSENSYTFSVSISSPDKGCEQYADWWEVVSESGELIYRRILQHSHVNEQPFTRSGRGVAVVKDQIVWIRAHMNNNGYGGVTLKGSVSTGFSAEEFPEDLGKDLDQIDPLPSGCAF
ncbi:hypothetical protein [Ekhidna sp.]